MVESDNGDSLSPRTEPEIAAPATMGMGIPMLTPMLTQATPMVPAVPREVPMQRESREHMINVRGRSIRRSANFTRLWAGCALFWRSGFWI